MFCCSGSPFRLITNPQTASAAFGARGFRWPSQVAACHPETVSLNCIFIPSPRKSWASPPPCTFPGGASESAHIFAQECASVCVCVRFARLPSHAQRQRENQYHVYFHRANAIRKVVYQQKSSSQSRMHHTLLFVLSVLDFHVSGCV